MANFIPDDIDFSLYAEAESCAQHIFSPKDYADELVEFFWSPEQEMGQIMPWLKTHAHIRFRPAEVSLWVGVNGHGKSLALGQVALGLVPQRQKVCIASLEMKPRTTLARMCRQAYGGSKPPEKFIREFGETTDQWLWFYDYQGVVKPETALGLIRYSATKLECTHFVLDSLVKCGIGEEDYERQKTFVDQLCAAAKDTGVHIHLVAHSKKLLDESRQPGKMDVKGSGAITDQVDNVFSWWRNKPKEDKARRGPSKDYDETEPDAVLACDKQRNGEWEGRVGFFFERASLQFVESFQGHPLDLISHPASGRTVEREDDF